MLHDLYSSVFDGLSHTVLRCTRCPPQSQVNSCTGKTAAIRAFSLTSTDCRVLSLAGITRETAPHSDDERLIVTLGLSAACFELLPLRLRQAATASGAYLAVLSHNLARRDMIHQKNGLHARAEMDHVDLPVDAVMFTQGVNEQQTVSNRTSTKQKIQDKVRCQHALRRSCAHRRWYSAHADQYRITGQTARDPPELPAVGGRGRRAGCCRRGDAGMADGAPLGRARGLVCRGPGGGQRKRWEGGEARTSAAGNPKVRREAGSCAGHLLQVRQGPDGHGESGPESAAELAL